MTAGDSAGKTGLDLTRHLERMASTPSEEVYDRLVGYGFARRYVRDKSVADIGWKEVGRGTYLLSETARSVVGMAGSSEAVDLASALYPAPNASYQQVDLPGLPYPEDCFDVAIAFGVIENLEHPGGFVKEVKRVLKRDGVLLVSTPDRQANSNDRGRSGIGGRREMYVPELRELLERSFEHVHLHRQGTIAGGIVFRSGEKVSDALVENARFSSTNPSLDAEPPATRSVLAACGDAEIVGPGDGLPYLLLDRDRRLFEECEDRSEDVELLGDEIRRMQETEVQAFRDTLGLHQSEISYLKARLARSEAEKRALEVRLRDLESARTWRLFEPYRRLRARLAAPGGPDRNTKGNDGRASG